MESMMRTEKNHATPLLLAAAEATGMHVCKANTTTCLSSLSTPLCIPVAGQELQQPLFGSAWP
eukprot:m.18485 g.18485  ORF g.18485 m.18485 type:complete len:63 (+) comp8180_c0_seq2:60-248(+)